MWTAERPAKRPINRHRAARSYRLHRKHGSRTAMARRGICPADCAAAHLGGGAVALKVSLQLIDAGGVAHEGERVKVDAHADAKVDVLPVALRDRR